MNSSYRYYLLLFLVGFLPFASKAQVPPAELFQASKHQRNQNTDFAFGADLSFLRQVEEKGLVFKDNGQLKPGLQIFKDNGYNWIRLRTCVEPATLPNGIDYTIAMAKDAKRLGFKFFLDFHYSNGWADPTNEPTPKAWQSLSHPDRVKALYEYTKKTIAALAEAQVLPDMVQIGNEVSNGMLWPHAKLPDNWDNFADYIYAGINGVDAGRGNEKRPIIMLHVDHGGDIPKTQAFFDKIQAYNIPYDVIGFSFYPWSHGTLVNLRENLVFAADRYKKDVYLVETGYYWKQSKYFSTFPGPFQETPEGQLKWLEAVTDIVMSVPNNRGKGVMWWEPAANGGLRARGFFDEAGNAQPVFKAFHQYTRPVHRTDGQ
ncbi:MAG: glycosyl hydrolase 53 family protein [Sphingobacteriaceae bacterium]|nr:glycosyl hydrolase 53 family protein [Sphingobacteriaceae bacterium]